MSGEPLRVPGLLYVDASGKEQQAVLQVGSSAGWIVPKGLRTWTREISVVLKTELTDAICRALSITLPEAQPVATRLPNAQRAAMASKLVAVESSLIMEQLVSKRVRVHTVGHDRVTAGFYYFARGGKAGNVRAQGNLFEMLAPALTLSPDNATLEACLDGLIDRILSVLSRGVLSEPEIELAAALGTLGEPARDAAVKLETLEGFLVLEGTRVAEYEDRAREVVEAVRHATRLGRDTLTLPLFGDAHRRTQPKLVIQYAEGESGVRRKLNLPERSRWFVARPLREAVPASTVEWNVEQPAATPQEPVAENAAPALPEATEVAAKPKEPVRRPKTREAPGSPNVFVGSVKLDAMRVAKEARRVATSIVDHLSTLPDADVEVTLEIRAKVPGGVRANVVRTVGENAKKLKFRTATFERE